MSRVKRAIALSLVTLAVGAAGQLQAAPVLTSNAAIGAAALGAATDVRWRGRGGGGWWVPGAVIGGFALGAAAVPYYGGPYYYADPYGGPYWGGYYWGPGSSSTCWDRGRRVVCSGP